MLVIFLTTFPSVKTARAFAQKTLKQELCACVQLIPNLESLYFWKGKLTKGQEVLVIGKTTTKKAKQIEVLLDKWHPYETPEWICVKPKNVGRAYSAWVKAAVG